jgi:hypothetical protein
LVPGLVKVPVEAAQELAFLVELMQMTMAQKKL